MELLIWSRNSGGWTVRSLVLTASAYENGFDSFLRLCNYNFIGSKSTVLKINALLVARTSH